MAKTFITRRRDWLVAMAFANSLKRSASNSEPPHSPRPAIVTGRAVGPAVLRGSPFWGDGKGARRSRQGGVSSCLAAPGGGSPRPAAESLTRDRLRHCRAADDGDKSFAP